MSTSVRTCSGTIRRNFNMTCANRKQNIISPHPSRFCIRIFNFAIKVRHTINNTYCFVRKPVPLFLIRIYRQALYDLAEQQQPNTSLFSLIIDKRSNVSCLLSDNWRWKFIINAPICRQMALFHDKTTTEWEADMIVSRHGAVFCR